MSKCRNLVKTISGESCMDLLCGRGVTHMYGTSSFGISQSMKNCMDQLSSEYHTL